MTTDKQLPNLQPLLAIRVNEMIGRDAEVSKFLNACEALKDPKSVTHLFYIYGEGGYGKTRFLEEIRDQTDERIGDRLKEYLCTDIIDLYDPETHSRTELIARIAQSLCDRHAEANQYFEPFHRVLRRYRTQQDNLIVDPNIRQIVHDIFQVNFNELAATKPILVLVDTAERLHFDEDDVQKVADISPTLITSLAWIKDCVEDDDLCKRTLFVVAGRPHPDALREQFIRLSQLAIINNDKDLFTVELTGLRAADVPKYFDALKETLTANGFIEQARNVATITPEDCERLRELTEGSPVTMSLTTHFWLTEQRNKVRALMEATDLTRKERRRQLRRILVNALGHFTFGDITEPLHYVALLHHGMTLNDLQTLWTDASEEECGDAFEFLSHMSFIKPRVGVTFDWKSGDLRSEPVLYMHDEIAEWIEDGFFATEPTYPRQLRGNIIAVLQQRNEKLEELIKNHGQVANLGEEQHGLEREISTAEIFVAESAKAKAAKTESAHDLQSEISPAERMRIEQNQAARRARRKMQTALMHYCLRFDPKEGYDRYFEMSEEVFGSKQQEIDARIRADFLEWWNTKVGLEEDTFRNRPQAKLVGLDEDWINSDLAYRWVQRYLNEDQNTGGTKTLEVAEKIKHSVKLHPIFRLGIELYCWHVKGTHARTQKAVDEVLRGFDECIQQLSEIRNNVEKGSPQHTATTAVLGSAYITRSLYTWNFDRLDQAISECTFSASLYRELKYQTDQARALNDKSYYLAQAGDPQTALIFAEDALNLRKKLGYGVPVAFTETTIANILILADRPQSALFRAEHALSIFRKLDNSFGEYLALRTLSEVYRRYAETIPQSVDGKKRDLVTACKFAQRAYDIAREIKVSVTRLSDCLDEYASALRDMGKFCKDYPDACNDADVAANYFVEAEREFENALALLPKGTAYDLQRVDNLINQAYLQFYREQEEAAFDTLNKAMTAVPKMYKNLKTVQRSTTRSMYWWQLTKVSGLRIMLAEKSANIEDLLHASVEALLYVSKLPGAPRPKRRTTESLYAAFKDKSSDELRDLADRAEAHSRSLGIGGRKQPTPIRQYIKESFGV